MKKILIATDFSKASVKAAEYALNLFNNTPCEFTLMNAYDSFPSGNSPEVAYSMLEELYKRSKLDLYAYLEEVKKLDIHKIHKFKSDLVPTSPASAIHILNQKNKYDFVIVGANGKGEDILFGSTATDIVRNVPVNTIVVPVQSKVEPIKNVVLAVDYNPIASFKEFDGLKELLLQKKATLTLLTVLKEGQTAAEMDGLLKFEYHHYFKGVTVIDYQLHAESVEEGIIEYLAFHKADMLAMLTRHHSFFDVLFNRSLTRKFAYNPTVPLLSVFDSIEVEVPEHEIVTF
ncbi:universal stress protein [Emticicia sp. 17c]|uniref:universal stress protein n=1 Tax=Emticicia sp. 17c TaxID=3127704 RepID=UPI00301B8333